MSKIKIIEVRSELGAGTRGASLGIDALKIASVNQGSKLFAQIATEALPTDNKALYEREIYENARRIRDIKEVEELVCSSVSHTLLSDNFPIVLAGDHSTAAGTIMGMKQAQPKGRIGVIWIDAHADLHTPWTTPSGNMHGMPLAMCLGINNEDQNVNEVEEEVARAWKEMQQIGGPGPKVDAADIVFIGLRDTEGPEDHIIQKQGMQVYRVKDVIEKGPARIVEATLQYLSACDWLYVSFDVDSMDPTISMGTGTPVSDGLSFEQALALNEGFMQSPQLACWEMAEVNPTLDMKNRMAETAFQILDRVVTLRKND